MASVREITSDVEEHSLQSSEKLDHGPAQYEMDDKKEFNVAEKDCGLGENEIYVPGDDDEVVDPRLKDYPIPLVAKTVDLHNDPT